MTITQQIVACLGFIFLMVFILWLAGRLREAERDIHFLRRALSEKVSDTLHGYEVSSRRNLERKVAAIQHHLKIELTEEPARLVVKETP